MSLSSTVNASVLSDSGGPCVCNGGADDPICENNLEYSLCKNELRRDYVTSTSAISLIATFLMGLLANMPLGLAPGLGGE
jgi:AGZA family xanthine/uracil permease-like MFS transporter